MFHFKSNEFQRLGVLSFLLILIQTSCYKQGEFIAPNKTFAEDSITNENVTYTNFIHPLLKKNCSTCHGTEGSAKVWWLNDNTYNNAVKHHKIIIGTMVNGTMPPPPKFSFTSRDRQLMQAWIKRGLPQ